MQGHRRVISGVWLALEWWDFTHSVDLMWERNFNPFPFESCTDRWIHLTSFKPYPAGPLDQLVDVAALVFSDSCFASMDRCC